jgi:hypothetical protein
MKLKEHIPHIIKEHKKEIVIGIIILLVAIII